MNKNTDISLIIYVQQKKAVNSWYLSNHSRIADQLAINAQQKVPNHYQPQACMFHPAQ